MDTKYNAPLLPDAAFTDKGLVKDTKDRVAMDNKAKYNNNKGKKNINPHKNQQGNYTRFNNKLSVEENLENLSKGFNEHINKGKDPKQGTNSIKGKKLTINRKRKDKDGYA